MRRLLGYVPRPRLPKLHPHAPDPTFIPQNPPLEPFGGMGTTLPAAQATAWGPWFRFDVPMLDSISPPVYSNPFVGRVEPATYLAAGLRLILTLRHSVDADAEVAVSDPAAYQAALGRLLDQMTPTRVVISNEMGMLSQWPGTIADWQTMATLAAEVCAVRSIPIGGAATLWGHIASATYADILATDGATAASDYRDRADITPTTAGRDKAVEEIAACVAAGLDAFVFHSYSNDAQALSQTIAYARRMAGSLDVWVNELGFRTTSADITTGPALVDQVRADELDIALWYGSGAGPNAPSQLWSSSGTATAAGQAIIDRIG